LGCAAARTFVPFEVLLQFLIKNCLNDDEPEGDKESGQENDEFS
jgi:hypothetical protein